jgi:AraC-like DNA-binding protein
LEDSAGVIKVWCDYKQNNMKHVRVPEEIIVAPYNLNTIQLNGVSIVESCTHAHDKKSTMFLEDHLLLFVLEGTHYIQHGDKAYKVHKNEMILLKKSISIKSHKKGNPEKNFAYDSLMFFLKEEFLIDFIRLAEIKSLEAVEMAKVTVKPFNERLLKFLESLKPYFHEPNPVEAGLVRIKMLELLYDLANADNNLLLQLIQLKQPTLTDIPKIMEENYLNPVSLSDLAYLSGRSLSSFRRDFQTIFQVTPAQWIKEKRLTKASELLQATDMSVSDICYHIGYENVSHFSRLYKDFFGLSPTDARYAARPRQSRVKIEQN